MNPLIVLVKSLMIIIETRKSSFRLIFIINIIGAIFCQVSRIKELFQFKPSITSGNQKWNGAAPNFVINAVVIIIEK